MGIYISIIFAILVITGGISFAIIARNDGDMSHELPIFAICIITGLIALAILAGNVQSQISDTEIWSGRVTEIEHKEEWDEWHPPKRVRKSRTVTRNGKTKTEYYYVTKPGYWEHHNAKNWVTTSDDGKVMVTRAPDGTKFNDKYPNTTEELAQWWYVGMPTSSLHKYDNYLKASSSIYKYEEIDINDYSYLPEYPDSVTNFMVDRVIGTFPDEELVMDTLNEMNSELNKMIIIDDPDNPGKTKKKSWKEINIIIVNLGDVPQEAAFALQEKWENGNKNDFIIVVGSKDTDITWTHIFSWTEDESLKIETRNYIMNHGTIKNFDQALLQINEYIEEKFVRKEMADYEYIQIIPSEGARIAAYIVVGIGVVCLVIYVIYTLRFYEDQKNRRNYRYGH